MQNHKSIIEHFRIKNYKNNKLKHSTWYSHGFLCTREYISIIYAHFGVTWFPKGNIYVCRIVNHAQSLTQQHKLNLKLESSKENLNCFRIKCRNHNIASKN